MIGGGLETVVAVVAVLLLCSGSKVAELIVAVLLTISPLATEHFTWTTRVMAPDAPGASEEKVTARLFSAPLETPPPVASLEMKVVAPGRMSVTVTFSAASSPLLVILMVYVRLLPAVTGTGATVGRPEHLVAVDDICAPPVVRVEHNIADSATAGRERRRGRQSGAGCCSQKHRGSGKHRGTGADIKDIRIVYPT